MKNIYPWTPVIRVPEAELSGAYDGRGRVLRLRGSQDGGWMPPIGGEPSTHGLARVLSEGVNHEEISASADGDACVVIPTDWDTGWRTWVGDDEVPVARADFIHQAVQIPAGTRRIRLFYRPPGFGLGRAVSLTACLGTGALIVPTRRLRPKASRGRP